MVLQAIPVAEPILVGACMTTAGGFAIWGAKTLIEIRDWARESRQILTDPLTGLISVVYRNHKETSGAMGELSNEQVAMRERIRDVERTCAMTHGVARE